jgi:hypothetical protein
MSWFRSDSWAYLSWQHSDEVDAMLDAAVAATTVEEMQQLVWDLQAYNQNEINFIPLFVVGIISIYYPSVCNCGVFKYAGDQWTPDDCWLLK